MTISSSLSPCWATNDNCGADDRTNTDKNTNNSSLRIFGAKAQLTLASVFSPCMPTFLPNCLYCPEQYLFGKKEALRAIPRNISHKTEIATRVCTRILSPGTAKIHTDLMTHFHASYLGDKQWAAVQIF
jgi:hypothetical protein